MTKTRKKIRKPRRGSRRYFLEAQPFLWSELANWPEHFQSVPWLVLRRSVTPRKKRKQSIHNTSVMTMVTVNDEGRTIGEDHVNAKYLDEDVEHARELVASGHYTLREISQMLDMPIRTIRDYAKGTRRNQSVAGWKKIRRYKKE